MAKRNVKLKGPKNLAQYAKPRKARPMKTTSVNLRAGQIEAIQAAGLELSPILRDLLDKFLTDHGLHLKPEAEEL